MWHCGAVVHHGVVVHHGAMCHHGAVCHPAPAPASTGLGGHWPAPTVTPSPGLHQAHHTRPSACTKPAPGPPCTRPNACTIPPGLTPRSMINSCTFNCLHQAHQAHQAHHTRGGPPHQTSLRPVTCHCTGILGTWPPGLGAATPHCSLAYDVCRPNCPFWNT